MGGGMAVGQISGAVRGVVGDAERENLALRQLQHQEDLDDTADQNRLTRNYLEDYWRPLGRDVRRSGNSFGSMAWPTTREPATCSGRLPTCS